MDSKRLKELESSRVDSAISIAKGIVGALPYGGSLFAEILGMTIPNQRLDRVKTFLVELDQRLDSLERESLKVNKYALDLFEDGVLQASRALTEDRNRYIAVFIKKSVGVEEDSYGIKKKLLYLLQELSDRDIEILQAISARGHQRAASDYYPGTLTIGQYKNLSDAEKYEYDSKQVSWGMHESTLERFGLIKAERRKPDTGNPTAHIDEDTGLPKITSYKVSKLGKVFLQSIKE